MVGIGKAELSDHEVGVLEGHAAVDADELIDAVRPLQEVLRSMPHSRMAPTGFFFQVAHVYRLYKHPRSLPRVLGNEEVHGNVVTVLCVIDQGVDGCGLPLEELEVLAAEEGGANQHHGVLVTVPHARCLQLKASVAVDARRGGNVLPGDKSYNLVRKLLNRWKKNK